MIRRDSHGLSLVGLPQLIGKHLVGDGPERGHGYTFKSLVCIYCLVLSMIVTDVIAQNPTPVPTGSSYYTPHLSDLNRNPSPKLSLTFASLCSHTSNYFFMVTL